MDLEALRQAVADSESDRLEFKKTTGDLKAGMRTLCAMLNGAGGRVLFGITPSGRIVGQHITDPTLQEVAREIRRLEPPAIVFLGGGEGIDVDLINPQPPPWRENPGRPRPKGRVRPKGRP
jgi:ATP-dependent DNA helicase RecG